MKFEIAQGSVIGKDHYMAGRNNQDAACHLVTEDVIIGVVADGCGSGAHSEVGAQIGVRVLANALLRNLTAGRHDVATSLERGRKELLSHLLLLANGMDSSLSQTVNDYFLFTLVGFIVIEGHIVFFSIGDGVFYVDGYRTTLGPFPNNAPPYVAYDLVGSRLDPELLRFRVYGMPTWGVGSILIGTDGASELADFSPDGTIPCREERVGAIDQFWLDDRYFSNPDMVRRKLARLNGIAAPDPTARRMGLLNDDTTLIVARRVKE